MKYVLFKFYLFFIYKIKNRVNKSKAKISNSYFLYKFIK